MCRGVFVLPQFKTVFRFTSEICGNVGIRELPVNEKSRDVHKCVVNECDWEKMVEYHCAAVLFCSFLMFCLILLFSLLSFF